MSRIAMYSTSKLFGKRVTGGLKRFLELYKGLRSKNIDVDLFSADSLNDFKENGVSGFSIKSKEKGSSRLIPTELKILISNFETLRNIKKAKYDLIIVFDVPTAIGLCLLGIKNIQLFIRQDLIGYKRIALNDMKSKIILNSYLSFMRLCETICILRSENIIIQCYYDYNVLIKRHRFIKSIIRKKSIIQINNVNPSWIVKQSAESNLIKGNVRSDKFVVGFIGDFSNERKGHKLFIEAMKKLVVTNNNIEALVVGDGSQLSTYKESCENYPSIKFTGRLPNPIDIVKQCDLMVVPSLADSCPNTVMESLYNEIPVIAARSGGIPEILIQEFSMFELDVDSLYERVKYFMVEENRDKLKELQSQRKCELTFDWVEKIIKSLDGL